MAKILVIDDDDQIRQMLKKMIELEGYEVYEAEDGNVGVKLAQSNNFDLVITDIIMPEKEGIETIRELKKAFPDIKIIAISGGGRIGPDSYLELAKKLGASETLSKPVKKNVLMDAIKRLIG
ncbi:MAG: response regulator [Desulfobacterales bacterium]|nr:response regulator [Desulfobacterales bacterium]